MGKKLEGVKLENELGSIEQELELERKTKLAGALRGIYRDIAGWQVQLDTHERKVKELVEKILKAKERLAKIRAEDWSAVPEWDKVEGKEDAQSGRQASGQIDEWANRRIP